MEYYKKSEKFIEKLEVCLLGLEEKTEALIVTPGTQVRSVLPLALDSIKSNGQVLWVGSGSATDKAVSCAEATKSRYRGLSQETQITCKRVEEFWEPTIPEMNTLRVLREVPAIAILLASAATDGTSQSLEEEKKYGERVFHDGFDP